MITRSQPCLHDNAIVLVFLLLLPCHDGDDAIMMTPMQQQHHDDAFMAMPS